MHGRSNWLLVVPLAAALCAFVLAQTILSAVAPPPSDTAPWVVTLPGVLAMFAWLWTVRMLRVATTLSTTTLVVGILVLAVPLVLLPPAGSTDVFAYGYFGRLISTHGFNPYLIDATSVLSEPLLFLTGTTVPFPSPYGPFWLLFSAGTVLLSGGNPAITLLFFRLIALGAVIGTAVILRALCAYHGRPSWHAALFVWQPYVLFEAINNAHNDLVLVGLVLLAVYLAQRQGVVRSLAALTLAVAIKYSALIVAPLLIVRVLRGGSRTLRCVTSIAAALLVSGGILVALFLPFWQGLLTFRAVLHVGSTFAVPFYHPVRLFAQLFQPFFSSSAAAALAGLSLGMLLFLLAVIALIVRAVQGRIILPVAVGTSLLAFAFLGAQFFQPWYLLWGMPLLMLLPSRTAIVLSAVLGFLGFTTYAFF